MLSNHGDLFNLPSRINYRILDKTLSDYDYFSQCNDNNIPDILKKLNGFDKICKMIAYNLYFFNRIPSYGEVVRDRCEVLNFWAYDKLINEILGDSTRNDIHSIRAQFGILWNTFQNNHECIFDIPVYDQKNFNNLKVFYDYANDYADIQRKAENHGFTCTMEYKEYIEKGNEIYNKITQECNNPASNIYCTYVQKIMNHYKDKTLTKLDCRVKSVELTDDGEQEHTVQALGHFPSGDTSYGSDSLMGDSHLRDADELSTSHSTVPMAIGSSLFGILFILFIFYKFTPLGSWVRERLLRRKMLGLNEQEVETDELLEHEYDPLNMNAQNSIHHIRYQLSSS
ncbi:PIR Superfamily Protein [Plasmodium ovale curtisi]|uniref:PIR Superfamily Protein n=1 Tax=Plasmodium ovale curtisi TaxID=864141 RepID=A0A1A8WSK3_PLAOA|nr:PIR Superfamily Protein [Plasmodium ovale curtisi]